jgi:hypothetical protein
MTEPHQTYHSITLPYHRLTTLISKVIGFDKRTSMRLFGINREVVKDIFPQVTTVIRSGTEKDLENLGTPWVLVFSSDEDRVEFELKYGPIADDDD